MDEEELRDRLLAQPRTDAARLEAYRAQVAAMLEKNEAGHRRERRMTPVHWIFAVLLGVVFCFACQASPNGPPGVYMGMGLLAGMVLLHGAVEIVKMFINRARVEVLRELKGIELRLVELESRLNGAGGGR